MLSNKKKAFFAYPSQPTPVRDIATSIVAKTHVAIQVWENNDIAGLPFVHPIFEHISAADFLIADITKLNFNVTLEVGYAIAKRKRCLLLQNVGLKTDAALTSKVGIFDSLGYLTYENSVQLVQQIVGFDPSKPIPIEYPLDNTTPVYLLETPHRDEAMITIASRMKKARLFYRSFNPEEHTRLAALEAIEHVSKSYGVLVPLLSSDAQDYEIHNIRAAFVIGLALGFGKSLLVLQSYGGPVGSDIKDFVQTYKHPKDITDFVHDFAIEVTESLQVEEPLVDERRGVLERLFLGDPMAENEFRDISKYYLMTDEYRNKR